MIAKTIITGALIWALAGAAFAACAPVSTQLRDDWPATQSSDCSFVSAAENDREGYFKARAAIDLGQGQVGQRLMQSEYLCGGQVEILVVLDCAEGQAAAFAGTADPVFGPASEPLIGAAPATKIANIQPPHGPIALGKGISIAALKATAQEHKIGVYKSLDAVRIGTRTRNKVNLWCGCARFYPGSAGAAQS